MLEFISLEEFLSLQEPYQENRDYYDVDSAKNWLKKYKVAKMSYDVYGPEGPPIGSKVILLVSGHGNSYIGVTRTIKSLCNYPVGSYFLLERDGGCSLAAVSQWWKVFVPFDLKEKALEILELRYW